MTQKQIKPSQTMEEYCDRCKKLIGAEGFDGHYHGTNTIMTYRPISIDTESEDRKMSNECYCHCHNKADYNCKCIKNCKHCNPENFESSQSLPVESSWDEDIENFAITVDSVSPIKKEEVIDFIKSKIAKAKLEVVEEIEKMGKENKKFYRIEFRQNEVYIDGRILELEEGQYLRWYIESSENPFDYLDSLKAKYQGKEGDL